MFKTGETVILIQPRYSRGGADVSTQTIGKVGRKYAYLLGDSWETRGVPFSLETGIEYRRDGYNNYLQRIYRPEDWEAKNRRSAALTAIKDHGIRFDGFGDPKWSTATLEKLLAVLNEAT